MKATLAWEADLRLVGTNEAGKQTFFDTTPDHGGTGMAASPMEVLLQSVAACSSMDVLSILHKKRRTITGFRVEMDAERAGDHPKIFTSMRLKYIVESPDAQEADVQRAIELSQTTYCSAAAMMRLAGCELVWEQEIIRP